MFICKNNNSRSRFKSGFTLIELLVVIVIIGILATLATVALTSSRANARDARRISDLKQIASAVELYYADNNSYPTLITGGNALVNPNDSSKVYMKKVPSDPSTNTSYAYGGNSNFTLRAILEKNTGELPAGNIIITSKGGVKVPSNTDARLVDDALTFGGSLVRHWPLDSITGTTNITGVVHTLGTWPASTPVYTIGRFNELGGAFNFDGVTRLGYASQYGIENATNLTICFWAKRLYGDFLGSQTLVASWYGGGNQNLHIINQTNRDRIAFYFGNGVTAQSIYADNVFIDDAWNHICTVFRGSGLGARAEIYANGVPKIINTSHTIANIGSSYNWTFLGYNHSSFNYFKGQLADVRFYTKDLIADEILTIYNATRP